jgi:hypothetical protein
MQAIITKYLGPTNFRGSRIKASCQAKSVTMSWDHALNPSSNHLAAAIKLATLLRWDYGVWVAGDLPDGSTVFCCHDAKGISDTFEVNSD